MKPRSLLISMILLLALTSLALAQTQTPPPDPAAPFKGFYNYTKQNLIGAAEKMPAEHFSFKPTSDVRSFAEVFGHIINTNYMACAGLRGEANPNKDDLEKTLKTKDDVVKAVKASFDYCDVAMKGLTDATLKETFKNGTREVPKTSPLLLLIAHGQEHYGNVVTYMRLKGIVPPSSEPPPAKK
ncbi:MAG TPA: DinB family protein [Blastocatellia bacterium]|nr:DinB family protein [Blastocatellia bacterium]HMV83469.1 DinB family protein [Blastocatellia bacterium]HMX26394.1 DinB family protein [Blastocatellia bacterium]HMY74574.1 DinB family protein [Blastocatellia bacterium]HMZ19997.1 DinB family protein [Blastocatellia bacterium]